MSEFICPECSEEFANAAGLGGHRKFKHDSGGAAALVPSWHQRMGRLGAGQRTIKMLRPICPLSRNRSTEFQSCQRRGGVWWEHCTAQGHDPYVTLAQVPQDKVSYGDPDEFGERPVTVSKIAKTVIVPNHVEVALSPRVNFGAVNQNAMRRAAGKGFILPINLRNEAFPNGIAPACQYRECFAQHGAPGIKLKEYKPGVFCREAEARLVHFDQEGKVLEYDHDRDPISQSIREQMLAEVNV